VNFDVFLRKAKIKLEWSKACNQLVAKLFLYLPLKEATMAKHNSKAAGKLAETAKESAMLRMLRIDGSQNGATLRTKVVRDKTKYNRNVKHKKSFADARDFAFIYLMPVRVAG